MTASLENERIRDLAAALRDLNLIGEHFVATSLSGGVSCDIYLFEQHDRAPVVVKRALPKLRVEADWRAPVERAETEVEWIKLAARVDARIVPSVIGQDRNRHLFAMTYLPKSQFPVWKDELSAGVVDLTFAGAVGRWLARLHASTAHSPSIASLFAETAQFRALRLEPYLLHAAEKNPGVSAELHTIVDEIAQSEIALMQGDISPKNILHGPQTPVFLDAETACYGDPAFDLAFCLNHLLLKCVWHPEWTARYAEAFNVLREQYLMSVNWEDPVALEDRAARILGGLLLARVDGKSPVEYITSDEKRAFVRNQAQNHLRMHTAKLTGIVEAWKAAVLAYFTVSGTR